MLDPVGNEEEKDPVVQGVDVSEENSSEGQSSSASHEISVGTSDTSSDDMDGVEDLGRRGEKRPHERW